MYGTRVNTYADDGLLSGLPSRRGRPLRQICPPSRRLTGWKNVFRYSSKTLHRGCELCDEMYLSWVWIEVEIRAAASC
jgi:hypothetical protein